MTLNDPDTGCAVVELSTPTITESTAAYAELLNRSAVAPGARLDVGNGGVQIVDSAANAPHHRLLFGGAADAEVVNQLRRRGLTLEPDDRGVLSSPTQPAIGLIDDAGAGSPPTDPHGIVAIDHVVCTAANRDTAVALFGAVLGIDFRLDQQIYDGMHQLFFRTGHFVVEVIVGHPDHPLQKPVDVWGLAWRTPEITATRERLLAAGFTIGEITTGRKRGTAVCTIKDPRLLIPTILIGPDVPPVPGR